MNKLFKKSNFFSDFLASGFKPICFENDCINALKITFVKTTFPQVTSFNI